VILFSPEKYKRNLLGENFYFRIHVPTYTTAHLPLLGIFWLQIQCNLQFVELHALHQMSSLTTTAHSVTHHLSLYQLFKELRLPTDHDELSYSHLISHVSSSFPSSPPSPSIILHALQAQNSFFFTKT